MYLSVRTKFILSLIWAFIWSAFSLWIAQRWLEDISELTTPWLAYFVIFGIAIIPGFMNAFMVMSLFLDKRKPKKLPEGELPFVSILIAAYNEEESIQSTLASIDKQNYPGRFEVFVIDDGSTDATAQRLSEISYPWLRVITLPKNGGKAAALNVGLSHVTSDLTITIDGDSYLYKDALVNLVGRLLGDPAHTGAVAGAVLVRNSRKNLVTKVQEWDYFHGIAAVKRLQSLYQGILVAQGAFSIYKTDIVRKLGGWPKLVGEDIVLTWGILNEGYRVGYAEDACLFTNAPDTWKQFIRQRQRWSRGLIEAFKQYWRLLFKFRMTTLFIWWNLMFPYMDLVYTVAFIPGIILALFGYYYIAGPLTLFVLPLSMTVNYVMYGIQNRMFINQGLRVRRNIFGFGFYALLYSAVLQPACIFGYLKELFVSRDKSWGTK